MRHSISPYDNSPTADCLRLKGFSVPMIYSFIVFATAQQSDRETENVVNN